MNKMTLWCAALCVVPLLGGCDGLEFYPVPLYREGNIYSPEYYDPPRRYVPSRRHTDGNFTIRLRRDSGEVYIDPYYYAPPRAHQRERREQYDRGHYDRRDRDYDRRDRGHHEQAPPRYERRQRHAAPPPVQHRAPPRQQPPQHPQPHRQQAPAQQGSRSDQLRQMSQQANEWLERQRAHTREAELKMGEGR